MTTRTTLPDPPASCCGGPAPASLPQRPPVWRVLWQRADGVWLTIPALVAILAVISLDLATESVVFAAAQVGSIAPWLLLAVGAAAYAKATSADRLVARAFSGQPSRMIVLGAVIGGL